MDRLTIKVPTTKEPKGYILKLPPIYNEKAQDEFAEKLIKKIGEYEDAEEQGLLLRLPCTEGKTVFVIKNNADACCDCDYFEKGYCCDDYCNNKIVKDEDEDIYPSYPQYSDNPLCEKHFWEVVEREAKLDWIIRNMDNFGKTVFLTKEEAEQALEAMKGGGEC